MESKTSIVIGLALLVFIGLFVWGYIGNGGSTASVQGVNQTSAMQTMLRTSATVFDFGTISMKNGLVTKEFTVTNPTERDITVTTLVTSCMCTAAYFVLPDGTAKGPFGMPGMGSVPPVREVIEAGASRIVRVVYDPNAHGPAGVGRIDRFVELTDASGGALEFEIMANVTP